VVDLFGRKVDQVTLAHFEIHCKTGLFIAVLYPTGYFSGPHAQTQPRQFTPGPPARPPGGAPPVGQPPAGRKPLKPRLVIVGGVLALVALVAVIATVVVIGSTDKKAAYTAQTFAHVHGSTQITQAPNAVAAVGPGDADAVLSLGDSAGGDRVVQRTAAVVGERKISGTPAIMNFIDTNAIQAAKPDLIIATGNLDDATYQKLQGIAPTITKPSDTSQAWNWQTQLQWIARILGRPQRQATQIISTIGAQQTDLKNQNGKISGKTVSVLNIADSGVSETLTPSNAADFLTSPGLSYSNKLQCPIRRSMPWSGMIRGWPEQEFRCTSSAGAAILS
jgi:hypothetical protein